MEQQELFDEISESPLAARVQAWQPSGDPLADAVSALRALEWAVRLARAARRARQSFSVVCVGSPALAARGTPAHGAMVQARREAARAQGLCAQFMKETDGYGW